MVGKVTDIPDGATKVTLMTVSVKSPIKISAKQSQVIPAVLKFHSAYTQYR